MYALASDHVLNYRITEQAGGFRLTMWEMAQSSEGRAKPYLYRINSCFESFEAAKSTLKQHLILNGATGVSSLEIPAEGKVRILPYPTWSSCELIS